MKYLGLMLTVLAAFALGYSKRKSMLKREAILSETAAFVNLYRANIEYSNSSVLDCLERISASERTSSLSFLDEALALTGQGEALGEAMKSSFNCWRERDLLSTAVGAEIFSFFCELAASSREDELRKCDYLTAQIAEELRAVRGENTAKRGFYETVYTLAGAAAAIALM